MIKDVAKVVSTNFMKLFVTLLAAFVIPQILSVDDYGYYKLYEFYASYLGITHLGFCDGVYLRYGGYRESEIDRDILSNEITTLLIFECVAAACFLISGCLKQDSILVFLGMAVVPMILANLLSYVDQAVGDFDEYAKAFRTTYFINFVLLLLAVLTKTNNYKAYIAISVAVQYVTCGLFLNSFRRKFAIKRGLFDAKLLADRIKIGFFLLIGNFCYVFFMGIDKWFIKYTLPISDFSYYSFGGQMITVINMVVVPVSMTLYSYMSRRKSGEFERHIMSGLLMLLMLMPMLIAVMEGLVMRFLPKYIPAIEVMEVLLVTQIFLSVNTVVFVNLYKVYKEQRAYFLRIVVCLVIAFSLDVLVYLVKPSGIGYALSTMVTTIVWLALNSMHYRHMHLGMKEMMFILSLLIVYLAIRPLGIPLRVVLYAAAYAISLGLFMKNSVHYVLGIALNLIKNRT